MIQTKTKHGYDFARIKGIDYTIDIQHESDDRRVCVTVQTSDGYRRVWIDAAGAVYCDGIDGQAEPVSGSCWDDQ